MSDLDHEAVKAYRDQFKFCPNAGTRQDIIATVTNLDLWKDVLVHWGYWKEGKWIRFNPLSVRKMLSEYERRERNTKRTDGTVSGKREGDERTMQVGVSKRGRWHLQCLPENKGVRFRASSETLDQIVAKALRQQKD